MPTYKKQQYSAEETQKLLDRVKFDLTVQKYMSICARICHKEALLTRREAALARIYESIWQEEQANQIADELERLSTAARFGWLQEGLAISHKLVTLHIKHRDGIITKEEFGLARSFLNELSKQWHLRWNGRVFKEPQ